MDKIKHQKLEAKGWQVGDVSDFLELSPEENAFIELKLALSRQLKELRKAQNFSQETVAKKIQSSQSRVAKMEACDDTVSIDLMIKTMLSLGATNQDIAQAIANSK
jgi:DNA-binding XRE family transcriptional regulator